MAVHQTNNTSYNGDTWHDITAHPGQGGSIVYPTVYPSDYEVRVTGVDLKEYQALREELVQLRNLLTGCMVCGDEGVFMLCESCRQSVMDARRRMMTDMLEFLKRENADSSRLPDLSACLDT